MKNYVPVIIIGAGQAGLSVSHFLKQQNIDHILLEKDEVASTWMNKRWDSFTLVTPNWMNQLPGAEPITDDPNAFLAKKEVCKYIKDYANAIHAPVKTDVEVLAVYKHGEQFEVKTSKGTFFANHVVVAVSAFNKAALPECSKKIPKTFYQIHSEQYKKPSNLPEGAILVVGSAQSGAQIAEELLESGRSVFLATGKAGRFERRYRGKDITEWVRLLGGYEALSTPLSELGGKFPANPCISGAKGGHTINLWDLETRGIKLLGGVQDYSDNVITLKNNLLENLNFADHFSKTWRDNIDKYIKANAIDVAEAEPNVEPHDLEIITDLNLKTNNISTIIWATGYRFDFSWIQLDTFDQYGYPKTEQGVSKIPGLYFAGMQGLYKNKSALIYGVGEIALNIAEKIKQSL